MGSHVTKVFGYTVKRLLNQFFLYRTIYLVICVTNNLFARADWSKRVRIFGQISVCDTPKMGSIPALLLDDIMLHPAGSVVLTPAPVGIAQSGGESEGERGKEMGSVARWQNLIPFCAPCPPTQEKEGIKLCFAV